MYVNARAIIEREAPSGTEIVVQTRVKPHEGGTSIELPGGRVEEFESLVDALRRPAAVFVVAGFLAVFFVAIVYSTFANWGWFKHKWITVKWCINAFGMILGTFWLGQWVNTLPAVARVEGLNAISNPDYLHAKSMILSWGGFQAATIIAAVFISTLKPWKMKKRSSTN